MGLLNTAPIPATAPLIAKAFDPEAGRARLTGLVSEDWFTWFLTLVGAVDAAPQKLRAVHVASDAAIASTPVPMPSLSAGLYRLSFFARITQAATTSSSLTVTLGFTRSAVACSFAFAAITGNTVDSVQSESKLFRVDAASPITYATAYASVGGTPMQYELDLVVERVDA